MSTIKKTQASVLIVLLILVLINLGPGPGLALSNTVVASGDVYASSERHEGYTQSRFWVCYLSSGNLYMKSSIDGSSWSSATTIADETNNINYWDCFIKYGDSSFGVFYFETSTNKYWFKKGTLFSNGTISLASGVLVYDAGTYDCYYPSMNKDSNDIWWVASGMDTGNGAYRYRIYSSPDGITFTNRLSYDGGATFHCRYANTQILPWTNGSVYFMCAEYYQGIIQYWIWNGASMSSIKSHTPTNQMATSITKEDKFSGDIDGNNLMSFIWIKSGGASYHKTFDGTTWGSETNLDSATCNYVSVSIDSYNYIRCFWIKSNIIYMKVYNGSWNANETPFGTTFSTPTSLNVERRSLWYCSVCWKEGSNVIFNRVVTKTFSITFRFTNSGKFVVNGILKSNGTSSTYFVDTVLRLEGLPNSEYAWINFSWTGGSTTTNYYNYSVSETLTIWCYFVDTDYYYDLGYDVGYEAGYDDGYEAGFIDGNYTGFLLGNETGYALGYEVGYAIGYAEGYEAGGGGAGGGIPKNQFFLIAIVVLCMIVILVPVLYKKRR